MIYHGSDTLDDLPITVEQTISALESHVDDFDSIVVCGLSGVIVGIPVGMRLGKPVVIVRKKSDLHHGPVEVVNASKAGCRWLFLDDFMYRGDTLNWAKSQMELYVKGNVVGKYLYRYNVLLGESFGV